MMRPMRVTTVLPRGLQVDVVHETAVLSLPSYWPVAENGHAKTAEDGRVRKRWLRRS